MASVSTVAAVYSLGAIALSVGLGHALGSDPYEPGDGEGAGWKVHAWLGG